MEQKQYFEAVPVSVELPKDGEIYGVLTVGSKEPTERLLINGRWLYPPQSGVDPLYDTGVTHFLRPLSLEQRDRQIASDVYDKFIRVLQYARDTPPDKELFLNSLQPINPICS